MNYSMPKKVNLDFSIMETPRSPVSISTDSSRRESLRSLPSGEHPSPPASISLPVSHMTRKRAASLNSERVAPPPRMGELELNSASVIGPSTTDLTREQVCLCQPDPKIPRPRNAFILYRQHYQSQVVAQNPGLANPDISKIIGEQWRDQPPEVKNDWKRLAEEEKQRHNRQYPGYRYQPRRAGKPDGVRPLSTSSTDDPGRCPKCKGRYISTPSTPITPFIPSTLGTIKQRRESSLSLVSSTRSIPLERKLHRMGSPRMGPPPHVQGQRRSLQQRLQPMHTHREREEEILISAAPPEKRQRFNTERYNNNIDPVRGYASSPPPSNSSEQFPRHAPPMPTSAYRSHQQLPTPGLRTGVMGPPSTQSPMGQPQTRYQYLPNPRGSGPFDDPLRLPPLQTQDGKQVEQRDSQALGVEAMVMSIPPTGKINILRTIAPPLRVPGLASPHPEVRGAVVAVEGADKTLLGDIGQFITKYLQNDSSCVVRLWNTSKTLTQSVTSLVPASSTEPVTTEPNSATITGGIAHNPFVEYLTAISEWHIKSHAITQYITTPPSSSATPPIEPILASNSVISREFKTKALPIALIPMGFSLTASDDFACKIAINDGYSPVDHWQWTATLWRGIVGPDVTVYTQRADRNEIEHYGNVHVSRENSSIFLRLLEGEKMDETTARRLGFEVLEMAIKVEERQKRMLERKAMGSV